MTPHQAFKTAFLMRAADEGLTLEQTHDRVKQALAVVRGAAKTAAAPALAAGAGAAVTAGAGAAYGLGRGLGGLIGPATAVLGLGLPALAGWTGGKMLAETQKDPLTVDEARTNEELAELQRLTDRARRLKQLRLQQHTIGG